VSYKIFYHRNFFKEVVKIPSRHQKNVKEILRHILQNPIRIPPNTKTLKGHKQIFRTRIGKLRLIYYINHKEKVVRVLGIDTRGKVYKIIRRLLS